MKIPKEEYESVNQRTDKTTIYKAYTRGELEWSGRLSTIS
jgi:hypothetical protein